MGVKAGIALKGLQWFIRGVQLLSAVIIFAIYCYFLGTLNARGLNVPDWIRAVVGITGSACLYSGIGVGVLFCIAGHKLISFLSIVLDVAFSAAFIFVAVSNKGGASSCEGDLSTPFGDGQAQTSRADGMPNCHTACKLQSACLAIAVVAILFYIFSAITEVALGRHRHKENRFGPSPDNDYTSGYGHKGGILGFLRRSGTTKTTGSNVLPKHATPDEIRESVGDDSYTTERTAVAEPSPVNGSYAAIRNPALVAPTAGGASLYPNKYTDPTGDDALPMNTAQSVRPHNHTTSTINNPYDNIGHSNNPYDTGVPGPYPGSYSRPRLSDDNRSPPRQYPPGYRYSDGVYDA